MKVEIIYKPQLQPNDEKIRNIQTFTGITSVDVEYDTYDWHLILSTFLHVDETVRLNDSIDRIRISNFGKGTDKDER